MHMTDIRVDTVSVSPAVRNAAISFAGMTASAVAVLTDQTREGAQVIGFGFDSVGRYAHSGLLCERFIPRLLNAEPESLLAADGNLDPAVVWRTVMRDEKPGGHGERAGAVGLLDSAIWDIVAKLEDKPLWRVLAERYRDGAMPSNEQVPTYASGGHYGTDGRDHDIRSELAAMRDLGHTRFKIKGGGESIDGDRQRIEAALEVVGAGEHLAIDLNGTFDKRRAETFLDAVAPYGLAWIEEPCDPLDFELHADLCRRYNTPIGVGENVFSLADARNLLRHGGLREQSDILQFDIALSYGIVEYVRILELAESRGWSRTSFYPHAGHIFSLHAVAGLGLGSHETGTDATSLMGGYPQGCAVDNGMVSLPQAPGVGFEQKQNLYEIMRKLAG